MIPFEEVCQERLENMLDAIDGEVFLLLVENHWGLSLAWTTDREDGG